jgi:Spermine/spermidine synthase domain
MLFVELALIRWTGSNIVYLSYFSNFVLLGSFLGIGIGFLRSGSRAPLFPWAAPALALLVFFVLVVPVQVDRTGAQLIFFGGSPTGLPIWLTLPIVFLVVATIMAMIADGVARTFVTFEPLDAYRLDIVGSIIGIAAFSALSFLGTPPIAWGVVVGICFVMLGLPRPRPVVLLSVVALAVMLGAESLAAYTAWSPYYKVLARPVGDGAYSVWVNGIPHQAIESTSARRTNDPLYFTPYERARNVPRRVLIIGAGTGGDVAIALANGAERVDAVEIDPHLYELGKQLNPEHPYQDPRVHVHITDGRAFLERSNDRFDMILFALPDSLTLLAGQSSLRLESYLFTTGSMETTKAHLAPGGIFGMYNFYRETWLVDRLAGTLDQVYGHPPCIDTTGRVGHFAVLTTSVDPTQISCDTVWHAQVSDVPAPATDDHPFVYLRTPSVPSIYLLTLALILIVSLVAVRISSGPLRQMKSSLDLFFMGAAFLLLETKNVVQFALLFGTTWFVNALVFGGILVTVLVAIEVSRRVRFRDPRFLYAALGVAVAVAWLVPPDRLLQLSPGPRFAAGTVLAFAPVFIANLIFAERFKNVGSSVVAFGANLLGAMVGGVLEYCALLFGYRALLLVVGGLYALAFVSGRVIGSAAPDDDAIEAPADDAGSKPLEGVGVAR